jgi:hypothetical protein
MKFDKYIGFDLHQATTVVAVLDAEGKVVMETIVATEAATIIRLLRSLSGPLHVTFEETTQARWMYDVVRGYVKEAIVCDPRRNKLLGEGSKADNPMRGNWLNCCERVCFGRCITVMKRREN